MRVAVIGHAELDIEPHQLVGERPVDHLVGDEILVGNEILASVAGNHRDEPGAQFTDPAECFAERDGVAGLDRAVGENDHPGNEVRHHLLQAEAEANTDGA